MHQLPGVSLDFEPGITEYLMKAPVMSNADAPDSPAAEPQFAAGDHPAVQAAHLVQTLGKISMSLAADLVKGADYTFQGHDYLDRNAVVDRVVQWRTQWDALAPAREALVAQARAATSAQADKLVQVQTQTDLWGVYHKPSGKWVFDPSGRVTLLSEENARRLCVTADYEAFGLRVEITAPARTAGGPGAVTAPAADHPPADELAQAEAAYAKRFVGGGAGFPRYYQGWQDRAAVAQAAPAPAEAAIIEMAGRIFGFKPHKHDAEAKEKYLIFAAELLALRGATPAGDS